MNDSPKTDPLILRLLDGELLSDAEHDAFLIRDRRLYAALLMLSPLAPETEAAIIQRLLAVTADDCDRPVSPGQQKIEDRLIADSLKHMPEKSALSLFTGLADRRVNNSRTSGWIRAYILGFPELERLAVNHRRILRKLLRHALGEQVTSGCLRGCAAGEPDANLGRYLFRFTDNPELVRDVFLFLFGRLKTSRYPLLKAYLAARHDITLGEGLPYRILQGIAGTWHRKIPARRLRRLAGRRKIKRETGAGEDSFAGRIRRYYAAPHPDDLRAIESEAEKMAESLPFWDARVHFIMDRSSSMRGFGHRKFNSLAIAAGILNVFRRRVKKAAVTWVGEPVTDAAPFPRAGGPTDIASALIMAVKENPDVILLLSDGYENREPGDAAFLLSLLGEVGIRMPVAHILPVFTERDRIGERRILPQAPLFAETGMRGFLPLWLRIRAALMPTSASDQLLQTLDGKEGRA